MGMIEALLQEFESEAGGTRKLLEVIPEEHFDWKPHEKSMTMGDLGSHLADSLGWTGAIVGMDVFEMDPSQYQPFKAANKAELLSTFDTKVAEAKSTMSGVSDERLIAYYTFDRGGDRSPAQETPRHVEQPGKVLAAQQQHRGHARSDDSPIEQHRAVVFLPNIKEEPVRPANARLAEDGIHQRLSYPSSL